MSDPTTNRNQMRKAPNQESMRFSVATWNVEWASKGSRRFKPARERIVELNADILCLTEAKKELLPDSGFLIESGPDYGYGVQPSRRKVIVWSRFTWQDVDCVGSPDLPPGRFASGVTEIDGWRIRIVGVCIPWSSAHVSTGQKNRKRWEDHERYLIGLQRVFRRFRDIPTIVLGDFNQRIHPTQRNNATRKCRELLNETFKDYEFATIESTCEAGKGVIDHVAFSAASCMQCSQVSVLPRKTSGGIRLSDHPTVAVKMALLNRNG